ncbi:centromere protein Chl4/mis15/CENP-N [Pyronema domesticum]|uniref:Similar to Kinetochore protein mis15 acc. no. Q9C0W0 n=1 Tax=Pyronema omphalodes (strain CBS 100304) TaxID=1076935 RepID=U4KXY8_PYROM|nr:centromere protein Chl4/mis15/CENP-N [Pyronema domesticum]CCX06806.1 Similar to Kinetochore protein mis15; acc. no. Q9C0W0 [Pyronema omphalodes CBS 100304]
MAKRKIPNNGALPHSTLIPHTRETKRLLTRLSKPALITIATRWLNPVSTRYYGANLSPPEDEDPNSDDEYTAETSIAAYEVLSNNLTIRAKDVAERMLEREWRDGLTLLGVAELEWQYLIDTPTSTKWQAFLLSPLSVTTSARPRFYAPSFLSSLQVALKPLLTAHFFAAPHPSLPLTMIRISLHSPSSAPSYPVKTHIFWLSFPSSGDHVFSNLSASKQNGLRDIVMAAIGSAISRHGCRWELKSGRLTAKTLESMVHHRGAEEGGGMLAGWGVYLEGFEPSPLAAVEKLREEEEEGLDDEDQVRRKRRKMVEGRFGKETKEEARIESVNFDVEDKFGGTSWRPTIGILLEGGHVFAGIRGMAETGKGIRVEKLPGWMCGDEGVSSGIVRDRKVLRKKGQGRWSKA